jgi:hypothetical protein
MKKGVGKVKNCTFSIAILLVFVGDAPRNIITE